MPIVIRHDDPALLANQALAVGAEKQRQVNFGESLQQEEQQQREAQAQNQYAQQIQQNAEHAREFSTEQSRLGLEDDLRRQQYDASYQHQRDLEQMRLDAESQAADKRYSNQGQMQDDRQQFTAEQNTQKQEAKSGTDWWKDITGTVGKVAQSAGRIGQEVLRQGALNQREAQRDTIKQQIRQEMASGRMDQTKARAARDFFESGIREAQNEYQAAVKEGRIDDANALGDLYKKRVADWQEFLRPSTQPSAPTAAAPQMQVPHLAYDSQSVQPPVSPYAVAATGSPQVQPPSQPSGRIYLNPQTGQKIRWNGSAWELAQ